MNFTWLYLVEQYETEKKDSYKKYKDIIERIIEIYKKIYNEEFYAKTSEKILNEYIDEVEKKVGKIEDDRLVEILKPRLDDMKYKVKEKWSYELIEILSKKRKEKGYTLKELSKKANISESYIYRLENHERYRVSFDKLKCISSALDIDINDLILEATEKNEVKIRDLGYNVKTIKELIKDSIIINENNELLSSKEKNKLIMLLTN